ncbi:MAG: diguanylate cyclase [Sphingobium sp.]|nr:diguanylate cyclase [Sphingobium sp.]
MAVRLSVQPATHQFAICVAAGYFILASLALHFTRYDGGAAFVWLASPFLFAALTVAPRRQRLSLSLWCIPVMVISTLLFGLGWRVAVPLALANVAEAYVAAWCVRRTFPRFGQFGSSIEIFWFTLIAGVAVPAIFATVGALFVNLVAGTPYLATWRDWFTAHAVGMIAFGPPMIFLLGGHLKRWSYAVSRSKALETVAIMAFVLAVCIITFGQSRIPLLAAPFLPMMLATLRLGRFGAVTSIVILIAVASIFSLSGVGPTILVPGGMGVRLQVLQLYFATVVLVILPTAGELKARRRIYERLRTAEALNRLILDHSSDVIIRLSLDGIIHYVSPAVRRYDVAAPEELKGMQFETLVHENDRHRVMTAHAAAIVSPHEIFSIEWQTAGVRQPSRWFEAHARAIIGEDAMVTGVVYVVRDVTERHQHAVELELRANTDPLTGLVNRRVFDLALENAIVTAERAPACLAIFDLDHFKAVNDHYGHPSGDLALTHFAEILKSCTRGEDIAARLGGEEFAVILYNADAKEAATICERIRHQLATSTIIAIGGSRISMTVSVGIKQIDGHLRARELFSQADQALYGAKNSGRNRIALAA